MTFEWYGLPGWTPLTPFTLALIPFGSKNAGDGIILLDHYLFSQDEWSKTEGPCEYTIFRKNVTIPEDTLTRLEPPFNAVKFAAPDTEDLVAFSVGFYLTDPNKVSSEPESVLIPGFDSTGKGAIKPASGGEIAKHGAIGICLGIGTTFLALFLQSMFLKYRKSRRVEDGTWQEKMGLASSSSLQNRPGGIGDDTEHPPKRSSISRRPARHSSSASSIEMDISRPEDDSPVLAGP